MSNKKTYQKVSNLSNFDYFFKDVLKKIDITLKQVMRKAHTKDETKIFGRTVHLEVSGKSITFTSE